MSNLVQWNVSEDEEPQELSDDELPKDPIGYVPSAPEVEMDMLAVVDELVSEEEEEQDDSAILTNARLRLEQGKLYEMLMTSNIFEGFEGDDQAIKNVHRELKRFAKDRMEVMLGMKQPEQQLPTKGQFSTLEVNVLKTLAAKLSGGQTTSLVKAEVSKTNTLKPISVAPKSNKALLKEVVTKSAPKPQPKQEAKAAPKAPTQPSKSTTPQVDPKLAAMKIEDMTYDQKIEYNRQKSALYQSRKTVKIEGAIPMPSSEAMLQIYASRAGNKDSIKVIP
jgi:hypothetical protein